MQSPWANKTFTGKPKELTFNPSDFSEYHQRITYIVVDDLIDNIDDAWANEHKQRDALIRGLGSAHPDDWIILSDVDEIPAPSAIRKFDPKNAGRRSSNSGSVGMP